MLFFAGGYANIARYYNTSGFVNGDLARELGAVVVYAEHRFFGESSPLENISLHDRAIYMGEEQVLMDYVLLIK
jgi:lysosomal Pro-X carboxypeptidase